MSQHIEQNLGNGLVKTIKPTKIVINSEVETNNRILFLASEIITLNGQTISVRNADIICKGCSEMSNQTVSITDPVTNQPITISMSGIHAALNNFFVNFYNEDRPE
jgi:hypothetical protein